MNAGDRVSDESVEALEQQLADLGVDGDAAEVLERLAEAVFPGRVAMGDPARLLWPEMGRGRSNGAMGSRRSRVGGGAGAGPSGAQEQLEAQVRQSEARFRSLVEQLPAVVFYAALGDEENEVYVSPQIESLLGFTQEEWVTNPLLWYSQLHPDDHATVIEAFTKGVQTGTPFRATVRFFSRDGAEVWILGEARLIRDEAQRPAYFQGVGFDITMTKRAQEAMAQAERTKADAAQLRADAFATHNVHLRHLNRELRTAKEAAEAAALARSTFLTTMSHELRTPLNSVIVLAGLLADDKLTPPQQDMVRRMRVASDNLLELINDVLEFSRLRAGQVELDRRTFDLVAWVLDTLDIVAPRSAEKGLELRVAVVAGVPRTLTADQGRLRQVLLNLLANAVKFTASGFVGVRVVAKELDGGRWEFECAVEDSGIGIRREDAAVLFDEFRQADSGIAREFGGTGLGLAICKRLCELLSGRIWIEEADGAGATVTFTWVAEVDGTAPRIAESGFELRSRPGLGAGLGTGTLVADAGSVPVGATAAGSGPHGAAAGGPVVAAAAPVVAGRAATLRILVAEDNLMNQQVALLLLSAMGHRADVVSDGDEAIDAVRSRPYDVVLMDVAMPGTDGLSATRAIRSLGTEVNQPYIVALTAHAFPGDADNCIKAGMDDYVAKPVDRAQLARALDAGALKAGSVTAGSVKAGGPGASSVKAGGPGAGGLTAGGSEAGGPKASGPGPGSVKSDGLTAGGPKAAEDGDGSQTSLDPTAAVSSIAPEPGRSGDDGFDPALPLEILMEFGPDPLNRLIGIFRTEATRLVALAETSVIAGDIEQAERAAHTLKSSAANLGAQGLYENCSRLEALARSGTLDGAPDLTATMAELLAMALARLDAMVASADVA